MSANSQQINEVDLTEMGFVKTETFPHDQYRTSRFKKNYLEVELTYAENGKLITSELTISELFCMPVSVEKLRLIDILIGDYDE